MAQKDMPTMRSRRLGGELRRLRTLAGLRVQDAAEALECGHPKVSQIETGRRGIRQLDLTTLLNLYGVQDEKLRAGLKRLAKEVHRVDWWSKAGPMLHDELRDYLMLESDCRMIRSYESSVLPGLLQTDAYMREVFTSLEPSRVETMVETRTQRQEILHRDRRFQLRSVVDLGVLHRMSAHPDVAREQLTHLLQVARHPGVGLQILPLDASFPFEQIPPFTVLTLTDEPPVDVVWLEHMTGATLLEQRDDVDRYINAWNDLTAAALSPETSRRLLGELMEGIA